MTSILVGIIKAVLEYNEENVGSVSPGYGDKRINEEVGVSRDCMSLYSGSSSIFYWSLKQGENCGGWGS